MNPQPKKKRIKLTGADYHRLRYEAWYNAGGCCEVCFRYATFEPGRENHGVIHHVKSKGSGGDDSLENVVWLCNVCHDKVHRGLIKI